MVETLQETIATLEGIWKYFESQLAAGEVISTTSYNLVNSRLGAARRELSKIQDEEHLSSKWDSTPGAHSTKRGFKVIRVTTGGVATLRCCACFEPVHSGFCHHGKVLDGWSRLTVEKKDGEETKITVPSYSKGWLCEACSSYSEYMTNTRTGQSLPVVVLDELPLVPQNQSGGHNNRTLNTRKVSVSSTSYNEKMTRRTQHFLRSRT